jgi:hypothetical protein
VLLEKTVAACGAAAGLALIVGFTTGHWRPGAAMALGLLLGSVNGFLARRALGAPTPFRTSSLWRLGALTLVGLALGALLGYPTIPFVIGGLAIAQLVLATVAAVEVSRT